MVDLISTDPAGFCWATGIENTFVPQVRPGMRRLDEYELAQHYQLWKSDFDLLAETGVRAVRWGIPWYRVQPGPNRWDWSWIDEALDYLVNVKGIIPILDLMHYGTPLWMDNSFINAGYPGLVAEYAARVAERYRSLTRYYTPLNEPMVNIDWCGRRGVWPPYLTGEDGYVKLALAVGRGIVMTVRELKTVQPDAVLVQVEAIWRFFSADESLRQQILQKNEQQYLSLDLTTGRLDEAHLLYSSLRKAGASESDLAWFQANAIRYDILGANFYPWSYGRVALRKGGLFKRLTRGVKGQVIGELLRDTYARYRTPVMITETSAKRDIAGRAQWMDETIAAVYKLRREGIPVVGYTWFPFFSMFSWFYRTGRRPLRDYVIHLGLYDASFDEEGVFKRRRTPLVDHYRAHMDRPVPRVAQLPVLEHSVEAVQ